VEVTVVKPLVVLAAAAAAVFATMRRRQAHADADLLWREATADASR
jgi:hypothetical protein